MGAQTGRTVLLKRGNGDGPPETFTTVAGLRTKSLSFDAARVDITNADSADRWRELLAGGGVRSAVIEGSGIFKDAASDETMRQSFFDQSADNWQILIPDFGTIEGPFLVTGLSYAAPHDDSTTFTLRLDSAGAVGFIASGGGS